MDTQRKSSGTLKQEKVLRLIKEAMIEVNYEINSLHLQPRLKEDRPSIEELEMILDQIKKMESIMSPSIYYPSYTRAIVDSWDINSILGEKLLHLAHEYKKIE